jgi:hypothetical protein
MRGPDSAFDGAYDDRDAKNFKYPKPRRCRRCGRTFAFGGPRPSIGAKFFVFLVQEYLMIISVMERYRPEGNSSPDEVEG